jgi:L-glyceraldehyde 3-phosphate reductase
MAIAWVLRDWRVTSAIVGVRSAAQLEENLNALTNPDLSEEELAEIDTCLSDAYGPSAGNT